MDGAHALEPHTLRPLLQLVLSLIPLLSSNPGLIDSLAILENAHPGDPSPEIQRAVDNLKAAGILSTVAITRAQVVDDVLALMRAHLTTQHDQLPSLRVPTSPEGTTHVDPLSLHHRFENQVCSFCISGDTFISSHIARLHVHSRARQKLVCFQLRET